MLTARFIDMEANHLLADGTLGRKRVKPPPSKEPEELNDPHVQGAHILLLTSQISQHTSVSKT
jgi:hypothetical protein